MEIKNYCVKIKRGELKGISEIQAAGFIQGLAYALCIIPCETTLWDIEMFNTMFVLFIDCDEKSFNNFKEHVEKIYPKICIFEECEGAK